MKSRLYQLLKLILYIAYVAFLIYILFFADNMGRTDTTAGYRYNLQPLAEIKRFWKYLGTWDHYGKAAFMNIFGNIIVFMPFGVFLPWIVKNKKRIGLVRIFIHTLMASFIIEVTQLYFQVGSFDVDDIILNTIGGVAGFIIYMICHHAKEVVRSRN